MNREIRVTFAKSAFIVFFNGAARLLPTSRMLLGQIGVPRLSAREINFKLILQIAVEKCGAIKSRP